MTVVRSLCVLLLFTLPGTAAAETTAASVLAGCYRSSGALRLRASAISNPSAR